MSVLDTLTGIQPEGAAQDLIRKDEVKWPPQSPDDLAALKLVVQDMQRAEGWQSLKGLTAEWDRCDRLYHFRVPVAWWEGTNTERAHLGIPLVYEHVESIIPQVMLGLFSDDPPFMSKPRPGTSMQAARANDALLAWQLKRCNFRDELRLGIKSCGIYGMGVWKWGWRYKQESRTYYRSKQPRTLVTTDTGTIAVPQHAEGADEFEQVTETYEVNEPTFENINIRHIMVDPGCRYGDIRKAGYVIHRLYLTLSQIDDLRNDPSYHNIPPREKLVALFFPPKETALTASQEDKLGLAREYKAMPRQEESSFDPLQSPLEVLERWDNDHVMTVIQRRLVIRNEDNEDKCLPFCSLPFSDVLDNFWGIGIGALAGGEQRMQQGVINTFLDDLSLSLNGMFIRKRGSNTPTQQMRMRPGGIIDTDDEKGIVPMQRQPIPIAETLQVLAASDMRAQRHTAANELVVQGNLPSERSSITRTATGVNALTGGSGARLQYLIENLAAQVFVPTLEAIHAMNGRKLKPSQIEQILSQELNVAYKDDVANLINVQADFDILAASKLQARRAQSQSLPLLYQFLLTEPVFQSLAQQGKKINIAEMVNMLFDVSGWPNKQDVILDMSPDDQQRAAMQNPAAQQIAVANSNRQGDLNAKKEVIEEENVARSGRDVIRTLLKNAEAPSVGLKG